MVLDRQNKNGVYGRCAWTNTGVRLCPSHPATDGNGKLFPLSWSFSSGGEQLVFGSLCGCGRVG